MVEQLDLINADRRLFPSSFALLALRDSRYHNTAYALTELIDNSIDADAGRIELLCQERLTEVKLKQHWQLSEIAVLDNGTGMVVNTLLEALKFGGGTRHHAKKGIGKYGMGLPTSSMSQCKRVDVWTWQDGPASVWHSSLDADVIAKGSSLVPIPDQKTLIPKAWKRAGSDRIFEGQSGTLIVWSNLDKVKLRKGKTLIENTSREVGRIHRHNINIDKTRIRAASFCENRPDEVTFEKTLVANDPLYLMTPSSTPKPWDNEAMFEQWLKDRPKKFYTPTVDGREETIEVKYSIVKRDALRTDKAQYPGKTDRGWHARHNIGVSVVRENREIVLESAFRREGGSTDDPQNRWWGCEVHFQRSCDELFGVDHNKQRVANFTQAAKIFAQDDRSNQDIFDEMEDEMEIDEDDIIYKIVRDIRDETRSMMRQIKQMFEQRQKPLKKGGRRTPENKAVETATKADRDAITAGIETPTSTDRDRGQISPEAREASLTTQFIESGKTVKDARQTAKLLVEKDLSYRFNPAQLDGYQMFNVRSNQGILHINLNTDHPIYNFLKHVENHLDENVDENDPAYQATVAIMLLLSSWARMEDQTESREERTRIQHTAMNWGRQVGKAIDQLRDRDG